MLCGISRLSPRSLIATGIFFTSAIVTANVVPGPSGESLIPPCENGLPCYTAVYPTSAELKFMLISNIAALVVNFFVVPRLLKATKQSRVFFSYLAGLEFGLGLLISGLADPQKVQRFFAILTRSSNYVRFDPSLSLVVLFGILPSLCSYLAIRPGKQLAGSATTHPTSNTDSSSDLIQQVKPPTLAKDWALPNLTVADIDWRFIAGSIAFGVGWGLTGTCPGPAILRSVVQPRWGLAWIGGFLLGNIL